MRRLTHLYALKRTSLLAPASARLFAVNLFFIFTFRKEFLTNLIFRLPLLNILSKKKKQVD